MLMIKIPDVFPTPIAARLCGASIEAFHALGLEPWPFSRKHVRYRRETLELVLGREITAADVAAAEAAHAPRRAAYINYNHNERRKEAGQHV